MGVLENSVCAWRLASRALCVKVSLELDTCLRKKIWWCNLEEARKLCVNMDEGGCLAFSLGNFPRFASDRSPKQNRLL